MFCLCGLGDIDDEAEAEDGEGGSDLLHFRGVAQVEDACHLGDMAADGRVRLEAWADEPVLSATLLFVMPAKAGIEGQTTKTNAALHLYPGERPQWDALRRRHQRSCAPDVGAPLRRG